MLTRGSTLTLLLCIFALGLGLFTRHNDFEYYYHPDEFGKVDQLVKNKRNFHHPMLMLTTVDLVRRTVLWGDVRKNQQAVVEVGRWVTAAFAALTAATLGLLAARHYGLRAGWLVGVLTLSNPLLFELAHYLKEDPYFAAGIAATALALHAFQRTPDRRHLLWLAAATATAAAGKFVGFALVPLVLIAVWVPAADSPLGARRARVMRFLGTFLLVWLALNYWVLKSPGMLWHSIGEEMHKAYGNEEAVRSVPHAYYFRVQADNGGWLAPALAGLWVLWAARNARRVSAAEWLLAGTSLAFLLVFTFTPKTAPRYYLPIATALSYFAVAGAMAWAQTLQRAWLKCAATALVLIAVGMQSRTLAVSWRGFAYDDRERLQQWIAAHLPTDAVIAQDEAVNLPEPVRMPAKHAGRTPLAQRVIGEKEIADLGDLANLKAMGVTHVAICARTYGRYMNGARNIKEGSEAAAAQKLYQTVNERGKVLWESPMGRISYLQPGLRLMDIRGIP